jgi:hypothetical protein
MTAQFWCTDTFGAWERNYGLQQSKFRVDHTTLVLDGATLVPRIIWMLDDAILVHDKGQNCNFCVRHATLVPIGATLVEQLYCPTEIF